jgi:hypothetical protein
MKRISRKLNKILYSDIESLEFFQSFLLVFVNPLNLFYAKYAENTEMIYIYILCFCCILVGITNLVCLLLENLSFRLHVARAHWVITLTITIYILRCDILSLDKSLLSYYIVQSIFCLFVMSRLFLEYRYRRKVRHG